MKIVLTSFTSLHSPGGVPRFNRDFFSGFPSGSVVHYSWEDVVKETGRDYPLPEWEKAKFLAKFLIQKKLVTPEDIIVGDGFWADGYWPDRTVTHAHGNWSHTTADDVAAGIPPEFPEHHAAQLDFRRRHNSAGGRMTAVSDFIAHQCQIQWGFEMQVINNGIDLTKFFPAEYRVPRKRPVIIHGVTTHNKGFDHVRALQKEIDADILLLDDASAFFSMPKYRALAQADVFFSPSAHEGNSYAVLEALASNVPVIGYGVGLLYVFRGDPTFSGPGIILNRKQRSPQLSVSGVKYFLNTDGSLYSARLCAADFSLEKFQENWRSYMRKEFNFPC